MTVHIISVSYYGLIFCQHKKYIILKIYNDIVMDQIFKINKTLIDTELVSIVINYLLYFDIVDWSHQ